MCNCKNQAAPAPPRQKIIEVITPEVLTEPTYNREDIQRVIDYVTSFDKTKEEKEFVYTLMKDLFGDNMPDYCDQNCIKHLRVRTEQMIQNLTRYENQ